MPAVIACDVEAQTLIALHCGGTRTSTQRQSDVLYARQFGFVASRSSAGGSKRDKTLVTAICIHSRIEAAPFVCA